MTCLTDSEITALLGGGLSLETRHHVEMHLDACSMCFSVVAGMGRTSAPEYHPMDEVVPGPLLADGTHRYVAGPEIARGGMGRILAGEDRLLGRPIALKLLRRSSVSLARRFQREQRITARLQHPAIVPVYDAGVLADGEPFFVMRLVKGQSLDHWAARATAPAERLLLLPAVLGVVDAVAYAHDEGVVHRDLKPQNVLVGPFGEVVVLDWGLARELGAGIGSDVDTDDVDSDDPGGRGMTRDGERLGTLAYMAPEQAEGHGADARSDVYGLGAILYHVLTGRPPHAERTTSLSTRAVNHTPPPLALLAPDAPPDLVAIVARAMARDPAARYASALDLAADLKRWQAGRVVEAYHYSSRELLRRFMRRHRAPLLVGAAALLVLMALGGVGLWRIFAERGQAQAAQAVAEDARLRAETQQVAAEKLVSFILDDLRPRVERIGRLDVLADVARAVRVYQDSSPPAGDAEAWLRRAQAAAVAGKVAYDTGELNAAEESYRRSHESATAAGDTEAATLARCRATNGLGEVHLLRGDFAAADSNFQICITLTPDATDPQLRAQHLKGKFGLAYSSLAQRSLAARTLLEEGLAIALAEAGEPGSEISALVMGYRGHLTSVLRDSYELVAAREMALAWVALATARVEAMPGAKSRYSLANALLALGEIEAYLGERATAERHYQEALDMLRLLVALDPSNVNWQFSQATGNRLLGDILATRGDHEAALKLAQSSVELMERCVASAPDDPSLQSGLVGAVEDKAEQLERLDRVDGARQEFHRASDIYGHLVELAPNGPYMSRWAFMLGRHGGLELKAHQIAVGQALLQRSVDILRQELVTKDAPRLRGTIAKFLVQLAESQRGADARRHVEEAMELMKPLRRHTAETFPEFQALMKDLERLQRAPRARR